MYREMNTISSRVYFYLCLREQAFYTDAYLEVSVALLSTHVSILPGSISIY